MSSKMGRICVAIVLLFLFGCSDLKEKTKLFDSLSSKETNITFNNKIEESVEMNYFTYPYLYMGGGVAIGDFDNDGNEDVFFTGNQVPNKLYLNKGDFNFEDVSTTAGIEGDGRWYTGVSLIDINNDGWLDVYLSVAGYKAPFANELYINNGDMTFSEAAEEYGIADSGNSYQGTFFDYDIDGDLDLLVINYSPTRFDMTPEYYRHKMENLDYKDSDHFYENVNGKFIDKTKETGLLNFGLTISSGISDLNNDGLLDIYLNNDFGSTDYLYLNNGDKSFKEVLKESTNHIAMYSMGSDFSDLNNDGLIDFVQLDMNPQENYRSKANMASMNIPLFWSQVNNGLHYQYMHNMLQLNYGIVDGIPRFSEISQLAGISSTDWSWSVLAFDINNDASKDLFITNGTKREINNRDFFIKTKPILSFASPERKYKESLKIPSEPIANFLYENQGNLKFNDISKESGIDDLSFSNGMAYADLDKDGDLDIVINNIDKEAFVYENRSEINTDNNYIRLELEGDSGNPSGIGARVKVLANGAYQIMEQMPVKGYLSTMSDILHFGLNNAEKIDTLWVNWPSGKISVQTNVKVNQQITISENTANAHLTTRTNSTKPIFSKVDTPSQILDFVHQENEFDDFEKQILLPHKMSQFGPAMEVADFNADGLEDVFFGGSSGYPERMYFQVKNGTFVEQKVALFDKYLAHEGVDAISLDFDGDTDLDLYVVSGGNEFEPGHENYQDRFYINDGTGNFSDGTHLLPKNTSSGSVVKTSDFDNDGDMDLFVGTRHLPHNYPFSEGSYIYENIEGKFKDVTAAIAPQLLNAGMVTDAVWGDIDNDGNLDLMVVGEWMEPWVFLQNEEKVLKRVSNDSIGLEGMSGWWFSIEKGDLDNDGDLDYVLGNLGDNYKYQASEKEPFRVYAKDFNESGSMDIVLSYEQNGKYYPVRGRQCSSQQIPEIKSKFKDYHSFAEADIIDIYSEEALTNALEINASTFSSYILINENGKFLKKKLPNEAQVSSVNDILIDDFDDDGAMEVLFGGNLYTSEVETTRNDASYGSTIDFSDNGNQINILPYDKTGIFLRGDMKKMDTIRIGNHNHLIAALNNDSVVIHKKM